MKKYLTIAVMSCTALTSIIAVPLQAAETPNTSNAQTMTSNCALVAGALGATLPGDYTYYTAEVHILTNVDAAGTEVSGTRVNDETSWTPDTTSNATYADLDASNSTHLVRNGKSPNIFATDIAAGSVTWSNNSVNYTADADIETTFTYACTVTEHTYTAPKAAVYHYKKSFSNGVDDCARWDGTVLYDHPGNCELDETKTEAPVAGGHTLFALGDAGTFDALTQHRTAIGGFSGTDTNAGSHKYLSTTTVAGVVCNSPGPKGGTWRGQNLYPALGSSTQKACSTVTFNGLAPFTLIPSASLPVV